MMDFPSDDDLKCKVLSLVEGIASCKQRLQVAEAEAERLAGMLSDVLELSRTTQDHWDAEDYSMLEDAKAMCMKAGYARQGTPEAGGLRNRSRRYK